MFSFGKIRIICLLLLSVSILGACSSSTQGGGTENSNEETITLNAVSFLASNSPLTATIEDWIDSVEESTDGRVKVNWKGGPEVIPIGEQFEALNSNIIDVNFTYVGQYQTQLPVSLALPLSQLTPWEERENGFYDFMVEQHEGVNVRYIGRWLTGSPRIWAKEPIESIGDLNNTVIRSAPNYNRFFEKLGISSSMIDPSEVYTSLQTGAVEGFVYGGLNGPRQEGWTDATKYVLDIPFWTQNCVILMNSSKWDMISSEDQQAIINATTEYEKNMVQHYDEADKKERIELEKEGVKFISFSSEAEKEEFLKLAYDVEWEYVEREVASEIAEKARSLTIMKE